MAASKLSAATETPSRSPVVIRALVVDRPALVSISIEAMRNFEPSADVDAMRSSRAQPIVTLPSQLHINARFPKFGISPPVMRVCVVCVIGIAASSADDGECNEQVSPPIASPVLARSRSGSASPPDRQALLAISDGRTDAMPWSQSLPYGAPMSSRRSGQPGLWNRQIRPRRPASHAPLHSSVVRLA